MSRRLDYLPNHEEIKIYQDDEMFCINTDTMVLGEFLDIKKKDIVLDIGTNTGALLLYASKFKPKKFRSNTSKMVRIIDEFINGN